MSGSVANGILAIRDMTADDIKDALIIERASSMQPWTHGVFVDELNDKTARSYRVGSFDGVIVGFCGLLVQVDEGHITNIAIDPSRRRSGIGTKLLLDTIRIALVRKVRALTLEVRVSNVEAKRLYQRFGFAPVGIRPKYYRENNEDALIMWAHDVDAAPYQVRLAEISVTINQRFGASDATVVIERASVN